MLFEAQKQAVKDQNAMCADDLIVVADASVRAFFADQESDNGKQIVTAER